MNKKYRDSYVVYFGEKDESVSVPEIKESRYSLMLQNVAQDHGLDSLVVLHQTHSSTGLCVDELDTSSHSSWFAMSGDFLITSQKHKALMVLTADCVPLVLYDPVAHAVGVIHAGWKGAYSGVVQAAVHMMQEKYGTKPRDLICTFGPSARACCYEVSAEFMQSFYAKYPEVDTFTQRDNRWYFDNSLFLQQILKKFGILTPNIYASSALCSICNVQFCSFRREKESAGRQITMVALR